jgi:hypothetical protein
MLAFTAHKVAIASVVCASVNCAYGSKLLAYSAHAVANC